MPTGDITATMVGEAAVGSAALKTLLDALNTGAATSKDDTTTILLIPTANGQQISVVKLARLA